MIEKVLMAICTKVVHIIVDKVYRYIAGRFRQWWREREKGKAASDSGKKQKQP